MYMHLAVSGPTLRLPVLPVADNWIDEDVYMYQYMLRISSCYILTKDKGGYLLHCQITRWDKNASK